VRRRLTPEAIQRAGQLRDEGHTIDEVAAALGVSRRSAFRALAQTQPAPLLPPGPEPDPGHPEHDRDRVLPPAVQNLADRPELEAERIRAELPTYRDVALWGLLAYAGLRPEEALALRWADVGSVLVIDKAWTAGELKATKTHQRRAVEVIAPLARDLALLREHVPAEPGDLVAPNGVGGHLSLHNWRSRAFYPAALAAGHYREVREDKRLVRKPTVSPGDGRHTFASLLIHEARSVLLVQAALGHSSGEMVWRRYAHVFEAARPA
jgi:integrase